MRTNTVLDSPYLDLAAISAIMLVSSVGNANPSRPNNLSPLKSTTSEPGEIISVLASWATATTLTGQANAIRDVHSRLRAIIPEQLDGGHIASAEKLPGLIKLDANAQYLSLAVYL